MYILNNYYTRIPFFFRCFSAGQKLNAEFLQPDTMPPNYDDHIDPFPTYTKFHHHK